MNYGKATLNKEAKGEMTIVENENLITGEVARKEEDTSISEDPIQNNNNTLSKDMNRGCSVNDTTKTNLLNNLTTINTNDLKSIKDKLEFILNYLNIRANVNYRISNRKTFGLITARLREGFTAEDFKVVIDKKVSEWSGTNFEQYLNPFTLFGDKFELYLNQKVASKKNNGNGGVGNSKSGKFYKQDTRKLRFHNFTGREVDYDAIEKQLLGWE
ncbi:MAG: conserved phage C-terminal domain-containing protein [Clostridium sp.]|nr:conserved phage C-terminal domain-containing protein [Clostridium sp.]